MTVVIPESSVPPLQPRPTAAIAPTANHATLRAMDRRGFLLAATSLLVAPASTAWARKKKKRKRRRRKRRRTPKALKNLEKAVRLVSSKARLVDGRRWDFRLKGVRLTCVADIEADRVRVFTPIRRSEGLAAESYSALLEANFLASGRARYAVHHGLVYAVWEGSLAKHRHAYFGAAFAQVARLAKTFGSTYSASR